MKRNRLMWVGILMAMVAYSNVTLAGGATTDAEKVSSDWIQPVVTTKNYIFDEDATKTLVAQKSSLFKVSCDKLAVLKKLGFAEQLSKIFSIWVTEGQYEFTYDLKNCSMYGYKINYNYSSQTLSEEEALKIAKDYIKTAAITDKVFGKIGDPIIMYKNGNVQPYPVMKGTMDSSAENDIVIIEDDEDDTIKQEYTSFSILFPFLLNGKSIYNQYGGKAGITLEVYKDGVTNINVQLLPFKGIVKNSTKMSADETVNFIKNWANSQFRGQATDIKLNKPEKVFMLFSLWRNNTSELYLSSGIRFGSNIKVDQWAQQPYEMIISDYKIGNNYAY